MEHFKNEYIVAKFGGNLKYDYIHFKKDIEYINLNFFELFYLLGLADDIDLMVDTLNDGFLNLKETFINKVLEGIEKGRIPKYKFISARLKERLPNLPQEQREKKLLTETRRSLNVIYKDIYDKYIKENNLFGLVPNHNKEGLEFFRKALFVTPSRIEIDVKKFEQIYLSFMEANETEIRNLHEQAAEALNRFFNGIEITQTELSNYFILEYGLVKVRPTSVNLKDYSRLGRREVLKPAKKKSRK